MKFNLDELKTAIGWIEANTSAMKIDIYIINHELQIKCMDKYEREVLITLWAEGGLMPKIRKTEILRDNKS